MHRCSDLDGPTSEGWVEINGHWGATATNLAALVAELGERCFGYRPRVGGVFCGGGSIPFGSARLGCIIFSQVTPIPTQ